MSDIRVWRVEARKPNGEFFRGANGSYPRLYMSWSGVTTAVTTQERMGNTVKVFELVGKWVELPE